MLRQGTELVRQVDGYINLTEPFRLARRLDAEPALRTDVAVILFNCAEALRIASLLLSPAMPEKMASLWVRWGCPPAPGAPLRDLAAFGGPHGLRPGSKLTVGDPLFMRAEPTDPPPTAPAP
jgi:methionyl-tRNA synthetase